MAAVVTVMNMKGGVGKTVVSAHIAGMLSVYRLGTPAQRRKVLAIDYDPQFNLSQVFIESKTYFNLEKSRKTSIAILLDNEAQVDPFALQVPGNKAPPAVATLTHSFSSHLHIVPSTLDLMYVAIGEPAQRSDIFHERFRKFIQKAKSIYDTIIIDCQPSGSILTQTALQNSDHVLIPVVDSAFAARGIGLMKRFLGANGPHAFRATPHILFNCVGGSPSPMERTIRGSNAHGPDCLTNTLKRFKAFADPVEGKGFVWNSGRPHSTRAFGNLMKVVEELVDRTGI